MREKLAPQTILNAVSTTGTGSAIRVGDFRHKELTIATSGMGSGDTITVKIKGSNQEECPNFDAAKSVTNDWDYIDCKNLEDTSDVDGDTGLSFADADDLVKLAVNVNGLNWVTVDIDSISDEVNTSVTATCALYND